MVQSGQHLCLWEKSKVGVYSGPDVSESGLVLALDAGNNKSHSSNRFISYGSGLVTEGVGFAVNGDGTFQRVAAGTVIGGYIVKTTDVVYSYALGSNGCHYHGNSTPIPAGVYATFTCDYLVTNATNYPVNGTLLVFENYGGGALQPSGVGVPNNLQNVWQRVTLTAGPTSSAGTQAMFLYPGYCGGRMADSGTLYMRNPRVEWTNVDTGTENFSSRPNTNIWYDMSGNGNNGTLTNTPYHFIGVDGTNGYMSFDGVDEFIDCGNSSSLTITDNITVSIWVRRTSYNSNISTLIRRNSYDSYAFQLGPSSPTIWWKINTGPSTWAQTATTSLNLNEWANIVGTYDKSTMRLYKNGVQMQTLSETASINYPVSDNLIIGRDDPVSGRYFIGNIAQVQIYNRALTASEIQQNFNALRGRFGI